MSSVSYINDDLTLRRIAAAASSGVAAERYIAMLEELGYSSQIKDLDLASFSKMFSNLKNVQKLGIEDANYILNLKQYDTVSAGITGTDSFYISAYDNEGSYVDQAFGWSDLTGGFNSVDSYINPFDYSVIKTLDDFYAKNDLQGKSLDQKIATLYNYVITNFSYVQENKDDWNFAGETIFQRGGDCEDLSILMASLGMALMINEGVSYAEANSRFAVVAGRDAKYGDHVYIDYTAEDGTKYVMDTATATQGNIGNVNELLRSAENTSFEVYFRFNDNQILKEPLQVSENKSYIDPNDNAIQKIVGNLKAQGLINEKMSAQEIALTIFRYFQDNFSYAHGQTTSINYGLSASVGILNDETFSYMMMSTLLGALKEVGFDTQTIAQDMYVGFFKNEKEGTTGYAFVYEGRVFDISNKLTTDRKVSNLKDVPLLNSLEVEELQRFDLNNNVYQRSISRFNPKYGSALGSAIGTGSKNYITADMVSGLKKDPLSALGGTPKWGYMTGGLWPGKSTSQITSGLVSKYSALQNHFNEVNLAPVQGPIAGNSFSQNIKAGVTSAVANMADFKRYVKEKSGFWYFDEAAYNKNYTTLNYYQNIVSLMSIVTESKIQAYNNVVSELFDGEGYKSINSASMIKNENDALTKGSSAMRDDLKNMISSHNEQLKTMAEKYLNADLTKRIEQASVTTIMATAIAGTVGFLGADTVATLLYYAGLPLLPTPAAPAGAAMIATAGVLKLIGGKGFDWFAKATAILISVQKLETEWIKYFNAEKKEDFNEGSESAANKTTASGIVSANYFADYKTVENGSYESGAVAGLYKGLTELSSIGFCSSKGFAYENETAVNDKLTELRRSALYLKARNKILEEKKKSYSIVHQELTGKGGYNSSALAEEGINREIEQIEQFAAKIMENRKNYVSQQNAREKATKEKDLQMKKSTVMTVAFVTGLILDATVPASCSGYVMALANYANTVLEYNTDTNYNPPSLNFTGSYSRSSEWDGVNAALYSSALSYGGKDSPSKLLSNKRFVAGSLLLGGAGLAALGAGAIYDGFNSLMGYRSYGYVNRDRFDIARRAVVTQATLRRMMFIVDHYRKEARNIVRQELSSMTSYTQSSMAEEAISKEAQYQLEVLGAMQSRQEYKQQYENEKTAKKNNFMKQQTTILLGTAAGLLGLIPMVGLLIGLPVFVLSTTSSLLYNSMNPNAEEKLNEQHEYDQYITSQKNTSGLIDKETWFVNSATVGAQTQRIMERGTVDYVVYGAYGKKTYLDLTGLQILGSLSNSKSEARAMVHQELTSIGGASSSSSAKASLQSESQLASIAATNFTKIVNDVVQMRQRKADAEYAKKWDKAKAIVLIAYYAIMMAFQLPWGIPWTPFDPSKLGISLAAYAAFVFAFNNFLTMAFDLVRGISEWYAASKDDVASKIETARIHNLKRATAAATEKNKGVNAMGLAEDAQADLLMGDSASDMLVDPSNPASIMAAQVRFKQIEKVKEAILKVSRATRSARAMIKAKTTGIVGGTGSSLAETIVKLNSDIADMLLGIMISTAQAKENYERANRNTWGRAAEVLMQAVQLANEGISLGLKISDGTLSVKAMQKASGATTEDGEMLSKDEVNTKLNEAKETAKGIKDDKTKGENSKEYANAKGNVEKLENRLRKAESQSQTGWEKMFGEEFENNKNGVVNMAGKKVEGIGTSGAVAFAILKILATVVTGGAFAMALPDLTPTTKAEKMDDSKAGVNVEDKRVSSYGTYSESTKESRKEKWLKTAEKDDGVKQVKIVIAGKTGTATKYEDENMILASKRAILETQDNLKTLNDMLSDKTIDAKTKEKLSGYKDVVTNEYKELVTLTSERVEKYKTSGKYSKWVEAEKTAIKNGNGGKKALVSYEKEMDRFNSILNDKKTFGLDDAYSNNNKNPSNVKVNIEMTAHGLKKNGVVNKYEWNEQTKKFEAAGSVGKKDKFSGKDFRGNDTSISVGAGEGDTAIGERPWDIASVIQNTLLLTAMIIRDKWLAEEEMKEEEKRLNEKLNYVAQLLASGGASMADTALMITADAQTQINAIADRQVADKEQLYSQGIKTMVGVNSDWASPVTAEKFKGSLMAMGIQMLRGDDSPELAAIRAEIKKGMQGTKEEMIRKINEKLREKFGEVSVKLNSANVEKFVEEYFKKIEDETVSKITESRKKGGVQKDEVAILTDVVKSFTEKGKVVINDIEPPVGGIDKTRPESYVKASLAYTFGDDKPMRVSVELPRKQITEEATDKTTTAQSSNVPLFEGSESMQGLMSIKINDKKITSTITDKELEIEKTISIDGKDYRVFELKSQGEKAVNEIKGFLSGNSDGVAVRIGQKIYVFSGEGDDIEAKEVVEYKETEGHGYVLNDVADWEAPLRNDPFKEVQPGHYECKPNGAVRFNLSKIVADFKNDNNKTAINIKMKDVIYTLTKDSKGELIVKDGTGKNLGTPLIQPDESALLTMASRLDVNDKGNRIKDNVAGAGLKELAVNINKKDPYAVFGHSISRLVLLQNKDQLLMDIAATMKKIDQGEENIYDMKRGQSIGASTKFDNILNYGIDDKKLAAWEKYYGESNVSDATGNYETAKKGKNKAKIEAAKEALRKAIETDINKSNLSESDKKQFIESELAFYTGENKNALTREDAKNNITLLRRQLRVYDKGQGLDAAKYTKDQLAKMEQYAKNKKPPIPFLNYQGKIYIPKTYTIDEKDELVPAGELKIATNGKELPTTSTTEITKGGDVLVDYKFESADDKDLNVIKDQFKSIDEQKDLVKAAKEMLVQKYGPQIMELLRSDPNFIKSIINDAYSFYMGGGDELDSGIRGAIDILKSIAEDQMVLDPQLYQNSDEQSVIKSLTGDNGEKELVVQYGGKKITAQGKNAYKELSDNIQKALKKDPKNQTLLEAKRQCDNITIQLGMLNNVLNKFVKLADQIMSGGFKVWKSNTISNTAPDSGIGFTGFGKVFDNAGLEIEKQVRSMELLREKKKVESEIDKELSVVKYDKASVKDSVDEFLTKYGTSDQNKSVANFVINLSTKTNMDIIKTFVDNNFSNLSAEARTKLSNEINSAKTTNKGKELILKSLAMNSQIYSKLYVGSATPTKIDWDSGELDPNNYKELYSFKMARSLLDNSELKIFDNLNSDQKTALQNAGIIKTENGKTVFLVKDKAELFTKLATVKDDKVRDQILDIYDQYETSLVKIKNAILVKVGLNNGAEFKPLDISTYLEIINSPENKDIFKKNNPEIVVATPEDLDSALEYCDAPGKEVKIKMPDGDKETLTLKKGTSIDGLKKRLEKYTTIDFTKGGEEIINVGSKDALIEAAKGLDPRLKINIKIKTAPDKETKKEKVTIITLSAGPSFEKELNAYIEKNGVSLSDDTGTGAQYCDKYNNLINKENIKKVPENRLSEFFDLGPGLASNASKLIFKPNAEKLIKNSDLDTDQKKELLDLLKQSPRMKGAKDLSVDGNVLSELMEMQAFADAGFEFAKAEGVTTGQFTYKTMLELGYPEEKLDAKIILTRQEKMNVDELVNDMMGLSDVKSKSVENKGKPRKRIPNKNENAVGLEGKK